MEKRSRRMPAPGTILGVIAIVIALGGSAYAIKLGRNSVKSKQIAPNAVKSSDIGADQAKGADVQESSLAQVPDAGQVDGHDATCPPATVLAVGVCVDNPARFDNTPWAVDLCSNVGGRLPSLSELHAIKDLAGVDLGPGGDGTWTEVRYEDGATNKAMTVVDVGTTEASDVGNMRAMRCVFPLVR